MIPIPIGSSICLDFKCTFRGTLYSRGVRSTLFYGARRAGEDKAATGDWRIVLGLILIPVVIYSVMLFGLTFPKSEREQAGVVRRRGDGANVRLGELQKQMLQVG